MAIVDLSTGKIYGCEEGSKTWYHEKAHIEFNNTNWGSKISYYQSFFQMIAVFFITIGLLINWLPLKVFAFVNAFGMILSYIYEEVWCWAVGLKNYYNVK